MNASIHPTPVSPRRTALSAVIVFALIAGPLAWFAQVCVGYALSTWPCYPNDRPMVAPLSGYEWTSLTLKLLHVIVIALALVAFIAGWISLRRTRAEAGGDELHLMEVGNGRTRFLALWGMLLGAAFTVTSVLTAFSQMVLPRCSG